MTLGDVHAHLLDSGCDIELVQQAYARRHGWKITKANKPTILQYMGGQVTQELWYQTTQIMRFGPIGDRRIQSITYVIADITENLVLGINWLEHNDPIINWRNKTWAWRDAISNEHRQVREISNTVMARKARARIIQSNIQANEAPEWALEMCGHIMRQRRPGELPPRRPGFDYKPVMKQGWRPRRERQRRYSPEEMRMFRKLAKQETNEHQPQGWRWKPSRSAQAVQMLWAAKAGGEKRPCHDYRPLNAWMEDDQEPLPSITAMITDMAGKRYLSSWDIPKAYHEIRIAEGTTTTSDGQVMTYQEILAFQCGDELYEPQVMQFGTKTAVQHFQRYIQHVLRELWGRGLYAYLDNIILGADTIPELEAIERRALQLLAAAYLLLKPEKCEWHKNQVQFCGFLIGGGKVMMDPAKIDAIKNWTLPWDDKIPEGEKRTAVREFYGFCNFYRQCIPRFSEVAGPLAALMAPKNPWRSGERERQAFAACKEAVVQAVETESFDEEAPKVVHTDGSQLGSVSGAVSQVKNGKLHPIGFFSKRLSETEQRWGITDIELFAIVGTFRTFRHWLHAARQQVVVYSDHSALKALVTLDITPKRARWITTLEEFRFIIKHIPGRENRAADALSRIGTHGASAPRGQFTHPEWFAPSGVAANPWAGMSHREIIRALDRANEQGREEIVKALRFG